METAAYYGGLEAMEELLRSASASDLDPTAALYNAVFGGGGSEVVHRLVELRADVNAQTDDHWKRTKLMRAVYSLTVLQHRIHKVTTLNHIFYHAKGATPLMIALMTGQHDCAAALIASGAQLRLKNSRGWTAADFAEGRSLPEFLQEALQGRVEACQRVSLLAQGWVEMRF